MRIKTANEHLTKTKESLFKGGKYLEYTYESTLLYGNNKVQSFIKASYRHLTDFSIVFLNTAIWTFAVSGSINTELVATSKKNLTVSLSMCERVSKIQTIVKITSSH